MKAVVSGVLAGALAFASPAMVLNHALHGSAPMPGMPTAPVPAGAGHRHAPSDPVPGPLQPCCNLCVAGCVASMSGSPATVVVPAPPVIRVLHWIPAAAVPLDTTAPRLLPPSVGPPALS